MEILLWKQYLISYLGGIWVRGLNDEGGGLIIGGICLFSVMFDCINAIY